MGLTPFIIGISCLSAQVLIAAGRPLSFNRDVRPILSDKCYHCHGPDAATKKIPLRLDREDGAKADLGGHRAIVDGDPASSELIKRITADKPARRMPPPYSGLKLTDREIETLRTWVEQGAHWQPHWSLVAPQRPALPAVKNDTWVRNPIDHFVLERLEREGLSPSLEAPREKLIRRVSLDLTGIPPTLAEIDAFLADASPNAYERVVDRLLASSRFGERMAIRWLDAARYADSNGYQYDGERIMWRWRDWVIDAFNRNQRFDQFTLEQLAGDLLPNATRDQIIATGFNRNHRANTEDGIIPEEYAVEYVVDRVETTSTVFLGLTLGCTRCHNHKYDPFTQKEFYRMFAYFNNVPELGRAMKYGNSPPMIPAPTREQEVQLAAVDQKIQAEKAILTARQAELDRAQKEWEKSLATSAPVFWRPTAGQDSAFDLTGKAAFLDAGQQKGVFDIEDPFTLSVRFRSDSIPGGSLVSRMQDQPRGKGYGLHLDKGKVHFHLTSVYADDALRVESEDVVPAGGWHTVTATYSGTRTSDGVKLYLDGKPLKFKVLLDTLYRPFGNAGVIFKQNLRIGGGWGNDYRYNGQIGEVRLYSRILNDIEIGALAATEPLREGTNPNWLRSYFLAYVAPPEIRQASARLERLELDRLALERTFPTVMVMAESPTPKDTYFLIRGEYNKHGEKVTPGVPAVLPPLPPGVPNNRLGLAKWLIDPSHPLLARVTVNRFWQMMFGAGLVETVEDFGSQGDWPSHPELLDWLATEFVSSGWDVKQIMKTMVMSAAYRQESKATPALLERDPKNRLLARGPRQRLPAEMVRDQALAIAGLLTEKIGGPSVKPYQPAGLWTDISMQNMDYVQAQGPDLYRRSLYTFWKRTITPPMMTNFDSAQREACVVRESRTNTPLQALNLMNDVTFLEAARFLGQRMMLEGGDEQDSRLRYGFRLATGRQPSKAELNVLHASLNYHIDYFSADHNLPQLYLQQGEKPVDNSLQPRILAAYASVGSLLLNLDEVITKE